MRKTGRNGNTIWLIFCLIIFVNVSCQSSFSNDENRITKSEWETNIIAVCKKYHIPTENTNLILIPPADCIACQQNALTLLDSINSAYILYQKDDECITRNAHQTCVAYLDKDIEDNGL